MKKRTAYRPRALLANPLSRMAKAPKHKVDRVLSMFMLALDSMVRGSNPSVDDWRTISDVINSIETMALGQGKLVPSEVMPTINASIAAMVRAKDRFQAGQGMRLDGAGAEAIRSVIDFYAQCLEGFTEYEIAQAQAETQRRVNALLRRPKAGHQVVEL